MPSYDCTHNISRSAIDDTSAKIIGVYNLESFPGPKEGLEHVLFAEYFLCIVRVGRVQVKNLDDGNTKVDIYHGATGNGKESWQYLIPIPMEQSAPTTLWPWF